MKKLHMLVIATLLATVTSSVFAATASLNPYRMRYWQPTAYYTTYVGTSSGGINYYCEDSGGFCQGYGVCPSYDPTPGDGWPPYWEQEDVDAISVWWRSTEYRAPSSITTKLWNGADWASSAAPSYYGYVSGYYLYYRLDDSYNNDDIAGQPLARAEYLKQIGTLNGLPLYIMVSNELEGGTFASCTGFH